MIRWQSAQSSVISFSYYPLLEICVGFFLIIVALTVPTLFAKYNGFKLSQIGEWIACIIFMLFFLMLGKSLAFQKMEVTLLQNGKIRFFQDMRSPEFSVLIEKEKWEEFNVSEETISKDESFHVLWLKIEDKLYEFYRSVNSKEITQMSKALEKLKKSI